MSKTLILNLLALFLQLISAGVNAAQTDAPLPDGVKAVWNLDKAFREKSATREQVCLNGLWRTLCRMSGPPILIMQVILSWRSGISLFGRWPSFPRASPVDIGTGSRATHKDPG